MPVQTTMSSISKQLGLHLYFRNLIMAVLLLLVGTSLVYGESEPESAASSISLRQMSRCSHPQDSGTCDKYQLRYFYDKRVGTCRRFWYGGCKGNHNRFEKLSYCQRVCTPEKYRQANAEKSRRRTAEAAAGRDRHIHSHQIKGRHTENRSRVSGRGNEVPHNLVSNGDVIQSSLHTDTCQLVSDRGPCSNYTVKWYFSANDKTCKRFWYGGCEGNLNRFDDRDQCRSRCLKKLKKPIKGSNCKATKYGCCADGLTYARGPNKDGCPERNMIGGCAGTRHGCCNDGVTSAHDEDKSNCVENRLVGGCAGTRHGCCNDGVTSAHDENKSNCVENRLVGGCAGTRHGCCADGVTAAAGPRRQGCREAENILIGGCAGTRYGCCYDGVTAARGERNLGCAENPHGDCSQSQYGCCEDETTAARGPDREGCPEKDPTALSCEGSTYGCCPDGLTHAQGPDERGCSSFNPASCGLEKSAGTCTEYKFKWYFDSKYGTCRQFWYGGCEGNANRFESEDECKSRCVDVEGKAICQLPVVKGPCRSVKRRVYYNAAAKKCQHFNYGGCRGNKNNFVSMGECQTMCKNVVSAPDPLRCNKRCLNGGSLDQRSCMCQCTMSFTGDMCENAIVQPRLCDSNPCQNGHTCQDYLNGTYECSCNPDWGQNCERPPNYWCLSDDECDGDMKCLRERECSNGYCNVYAKCAGSARSYACDRKMCPGNQDCVNDESFEDGYFCIDKIVYRRPQALVLGCELSKFGCCRNGRTGASGANYDGCRDSRCEYSRYGCCKDRETLATGPDFEGCDIEGSGDLPCEETRYGCCEDGATAASGPRRQGCEDTTDSDDRGKVEPVEPSEGGGMEKCTAPKTREKCTEYSVKWRFDADKQDCERHWWGGCADNGNVFESQEECEGACLNVVITDPGTVDPVTVSGEHHVDEGRPIRVTCEVKGGYQDAVQFYINGRAVESSDRIQINVALGRNLLVSELEIYRARVSDAGSYMCRIRSGESDSMRIQVHQAEVPTTTTTTTTTTEPPVVTQESSIVMNGSSIVWKGSEIKVVCKAQGPRRPNSIEWFINGNLIEDKKLLDSYNDPRSLNGLVSELTIQNSQEDHQGTYYCRSRPYGKLDKMVISVRQRPELPMVTRPPTNDGLEESTDPAVVCMMDMVIGNCMASFPRWFYDHESGECRDFTYGGCGGNSNNFESEEQCNRFCTPADVCTQPKIIGRCRASKPRFYFDSQSRTCKHFIYGGCGGNLNNFRSMQACTGKCSSLIQGDTGSGGMDVSVVDNTDTDGDVCELEPEKGTCRGYNIKWYYSSTRNRCARFVYTGCNGNGNRFEDEAECEDRCIRTSRPRPVRPQIRTQPPRTQPPTQPPTRPPVTESNIISGSEDVCYLQMGRGECQDWTINWFYNSEREYCQQFYYGGCGGNENRFETQEECENLCDASKRTTQRVYTTARPRVYYTTPDPRPATCYNSRYGCCADGVTAAMDTQGSNCEENNVVVRPGGDRDYTVVLIRSGADGVITCSQGTNDVSWYRDGFLLASSGRFEVLNNGSLLLRAITDDMAGSYSCRVSSGYNAQLERFKVEVTEPMGILPGPALMSVDPGDDVVLHCQATGKPTPRVSWQRDGRVLRTSGRHQVYGNGTLIILGVMPRDTGSYECYAENGITPAVTRSMQLSLRESIEAKIQHHKGYYRDGEVIHLVCEGSGYPQPQIEWVKEGKVLTPGKNIRVSAGDLFIHGASVEDAGLYKCVVSNGRGRDEDVTTVQIKFQSPQAQCTDVMATTKCRLIVAGRLCGWRRFGTNCCRSCRRAGFL